MKQTILSKKESPLLDYAISKLNPEVFSHPVWVRFGRQEKNNTTEIIDNLLSAALKLHTDNPSAACQLLLICSVVQNQANQPKNALATIQHALAFARQGSLTQETLWANWGASALCIQQRSYKQAAIHLDELQKVLSRENEWILADFVDMIKQSLLHPTTIDSWMDWKNPQASLDDDLMRHTFTWFHQWGRPFQSTKSKFGTNSKDSEGFASAQSKSSQYFWAAQHWKKYWHELTYIIRRKLPFRQPFNQDQQWIYSTSKIDRLQKEQQPPLNSDCMPPSLKEVASDHEAIHQSTFVIPLTVQMLGHFSFSVQNSLLRIPASRGLSLFKYLILHHGQDIPRDMLMDIFWPEAEPEAARNNLNVTMHSLRQVLRSATDLEVVHFEDGAYGLAPDLEIWLDVDEFEHCIKEGRRLEARNQMNLAVTEYEIAINLYRGDFLSENPYENWTVLERERLRVAYLDTLDRLSQIYFNQTRYAACANLCQLILSRDLCREDAHCRLMRSYSRLGQGALALRQYQICVEALQVELDVEPAPETKQLFEQIRSRKHV